MMISVAMEYPALAFQFIVREMQVPAMLLSQARGIGVHWKMDDAVVATM